jgi:lysophospholipase L1-like esterase
VPYSNLGTGNWVIYDNELGYRLNPDQPGVNTLSLRHGNIAIPKPTGLHRTMILGDSIPWDRDGFVKLMGDRRDVPGVYETINASVPGYTSYQELTFFKRYLLQTDPNLVIWSYCLNDNHKFLHQFDEKGQMLATPEAIDSMAIRNYWDVVVSRSYLLSSIWFRIIAYRDQHKNEDHSRFVWEHQADFNVAWKEVYWTSYEEYLKEMLRLLGEKNAKLALVVFPYEPQLDYRHDSVNYEYAVKPQQILLALCKKYQVRCLDLYPIFSRAYDQGQKLYRDGIHLNDKGHQLTAAALDDFLVANKFLPVSSDAQNSAYRK